MKASRILKSSARQLICGSGPNTAPQCWPASLESSQDSPRAYSPSPDLGPLSQLPPPCLQPFCLSPPRPWRPFSRPANPPALDNPATSSLQRENPGPTSGRPPCPNGQIAGVCPESLHRPIPAARPGPGRLQATISGPRPPPGSPPGVPRPPPPPGTPLGLPRPRPYASGRPPISGLWAPPGSPPPRPLRALLPLNNTPTLPPQNEAQIQLPGFYRMPPAESCSWLLVNFSRS